MLARPFIRRLTGTWCTKYHAIHTPSEARRGYSRVFKPNPGRVDAAESRATTRTLVHPFSSLGRRRWALPRPIEPQPIHAGCRSVTGLQCLPTTLQTPCGSSRVRTTTFTWTRAGGPRRTRTLPRDSTQCRPGDTNGGKRARARSTNTSALY